MASYKSKPVSLRRAEDRAPSRLPSSQLPTAGQSKLQKRRSSRDEQVHSSGATTSQRTISQTTNRASTSNSVSTRASSKSRLPKLEVTAESRTPSLASGSSTSTIESPHTNVLRRKQPSVGSAHGQQGVRMMDNSISGHHISQPLKEIPDIYQDPFSETVLGISLPPSSTLLAPTTSKVEIFGHDLYDFELGPTDILPVPMPQYALSATPSTRCSDSPGSFSVSSTPTSMSSYSPGVILSRNSQRTKQASPLQNRPPVTRHRTPDDPNLRSPLSTVRESSTSSSSASTVVADSIRYKDHQQPKRADSLPYFNASNGITVLSNVQAPPELAHLNDQSSSTSIPRRPTRPSRDGTPEITGIRGPSPIIQSNMSSFHMPHRRSSSSESKSAVAPASRSRMGASTKAPSRIPSPSPSAVQTSSIRAPTRGAISETSLVRDSRRSSTLSAPIHVPAPSPAPVHIPVPSPGKTSRFGFFTRRAKTEPPQSTKPEMKKSRKGPVAGTGHEGYGKFATRGRSGSSMSAASIGRSTSAARTSESLDRTPSTRKSSMTSTTSTDMDDFFLHRLAPVVIRGTGSSTELSRSPEPMHSNSSLDVSIRAGSDLKKTISNTSQQSVSPNRPSLLPSAMPNTVSGTMPRRTALSRRRPSDSEDEVKKSFLPSLSSRRQSRTGKAPQIMSDAFAARADRVVTARKDSLGEIATDGKEGKWLKSTKKAKVEENQTKPSKKWNFFQRAHANPRTEAPVAAPVSTASAAPISRSVAHYALMGQGTLNLGDIEQLMKEATTPDEGTESALSDDEPERKERMQSILLPPKPLLPTSFTPPVRSASPKVFLNPDMPHTQPRKLSADSNQPEPEVPERRSLINLTPVTDLSPPSSPLQSHAQAHETLAPTSNDSTPNPPPVVALPDIPNFFQELPAPGPPPMSPPPRPSRLPQVGRIPQVVSSRRPVHRPSSRSFSRPFDAEQPRPNAAPRSSFDSVGPVVATAGPIEPCSVFQGLDALTNGMATTQVTSSAAASNRQSEFFKFPSRKGSEVSYSSSSGIWSFAPTRGTAVIPSPEAPLSDDELWGEYDDLIDEVLSPSTTRASEDLSTICSQHPSLEPQPLQPKRLETSQQSECSVASVTHPSLHLRRSRLLAVLHSTQSPTSPVSFSELLQDLGEKKISVIDPVTGRLSLPASPRLSTGTTTKRSTRSSLPASLPRSARQSRNTITSHSEKDRDSANTNRYRDTRLMEVAETQMDGLVSMANLRFGALMTSKWLSFGRVLFSPVHFELKDPSEDRVLVIDGLGKDWSYYCALTYPEATIYDIGPGPSSSNSSSDASSEPWSTLRNHRHICHSSLTHAFPFPMNFFGCVVLRFPSALPSSVHRFVLSEAKRVLRPGGYLEFSVLDLDLVNMGNRARRAVRKLKIQMQTTDEQISLRNISDEIMAGIGRKGFVECNRCIVGVPVAGNLPTPDDHASSKRTNSTSSSSRKSSEVQPNPKGPKPEVSFSDLLNVSASSESTDNGITDMVARVGRWWYSRCYESLILPEANEASTESSSNLLQNSIWRDTSLINECEKRGTSFKLLIGYAQKPEVGVRRTVSV